MQYSKVLIFLFFPFLINAQFINEIGIGVNTNFNWQKFSGQSEYENSVIPSIALKLNKYGLTSGNHKSLRMYNISFGTSLGDVDLDQTNFKISRTSSVGLDAMNIEFYPYTSGGMKRKFFDVPDNEQLIEDAYIGRNFEYGVLIRTKRLSYELSFSKTLYGDENKFAENLGSNAIQMSSIMGTNLLIEHLFEDHKLYPYIRFITESLVRFTFMKLSEDEQSFPFKNDVTSTENTFNIGMSYNFSL